ncbi:type II secretion system minor pseudopilin GspK [Aliiglaciecola sp. LCG003]|uniref:type II secretion system minor pseudopilin GspK n=1 Tax=Aliiglaciecola sp. LCG003 TaxID=3053655 RepID=UPI0025743473|nr:type II secretion system minor pseudopilin GspK [Aliiglaciecola sp. LCG003]WJG09302.1 type II secretion system minor pseudopilin GspK [Aliiglaciecola sp. LCG003]
MKTSGPIYKQQGVALIIVLMIVALVAIIATEMGSRLQLQVSRATNIKDNNQAYWYAMGAEQFAKKSILELIKKDAEVVSLEGDWSEEFTFPLEGGGIQAQLTDMQTCFNLNALSTRQNNTSEQNGNIKSPNNNPSNGSDDNKNNSGGGAQVGAVSESALAFYRLLDEAVPDLDNYSKEVVRDSLIDWLDEDDRLSQSGAEDPDYSALVSPYLAANSLMVSKSELRLVNGVQPQWINSLIPLVCVIPQLSEMRVNVNTFKPEQAPILAALTGAPLSDIQSLINNRQPSGYKTIAEFTSESLFANYPLSDDQLKWFDVKTEYFLLHTKTRYNNATFAMTSLLKLESNEKVIVIRREFGGVH